MIKVDQLFNSVIIVAPLAAGALLSGAFYLSENSSIPLTIFQLFLIVSVLLFISRRAIEQDISYETNGIEKWVLLFLGLIFFSIIYTPEREQALFYSIRFCVLSLMTFMIYNLINSEKELLRICWIIVGVSVIIAILNLIETYNNPEIIALNYVNQGKTIIRGSGLESDPNIFASNHFVPIMLLVSFFGKAKRFYTRLFLFSITGLLLASVLLTYSRSAWIAVAVGVLIVISYNKKYSFIVWGIITFAIIFMVSNTVQELSLSLLNRLENIFAGSKDDSSNIRMLLAMGSIYMLFDSYLLGVGFQGFSSAFQNYYTPQETIGIYEPHNEFYTVYAELGIIGFIIFCTIIYSIFKQCRAILKKGFLHPWMEAAALGFYASFISYMIFYQFYGGMIYNSFFMVFIALIFAMNKKLLTTSNEANT